MPGIAQWPTHVTLAWAASMAPMQVPMNPPIVPAVVAHPTAPMTLLVANDRDRDGYLSPAEMPPALLRRFAATDADRDGRLSPREIYYARTPVGRTARGMDGLKLTLLGRRLVSRADGRTVMSLPGEVVQAGGRPNLQPVVRAVADAVADAAAQPETASPWPLSLPPLAPALPPSAPVPTPSALPPAEPPAPNIPGAPPAGPVTAEFILQHLDVDGDGLVAAGESPPVLADRFRMLDKNKDGGLDLKEIQRGLKLARMFGMDVDGAVAEYLNRPKP